eukprot:4563194-Amphidinium_carterae.1
MTLRSINRLDLKIPPKRTRSPNRPFEYAKMWGFGFLCQSQFQSLLLTELLTYWPCLSSSALFTSSLETLEPDPHHAEPNAS